MVFHQMSEETEGYGGVYQGQDGLRPPSRREAW